jgi:cell pole-organizing protein PopZ
MPNKVDIFNAVQVLVLEDMAKDFKNLGFGYNRNTTYATCHQGISPFMMIPVSLAQASQGRQLADMYARVGSNLTLDDVTGLETVPDATQERSSRQSNSRTASFQSGSRVPAICLIRSMPEVSKHADSGSRGSHNPTTEIQYN